ncbi:hypothetical protein INT43_001379 [Umbelopsis isabellina]|uniref:Uncharacterized protein n=1 Tax=Mortierella isabellina TaxID=91625 RepID=A0A8H7UBR1_MORIS|nr:hypothetical protein INT43_001379 [Umbelopsis isabellina]
MTSDSRTNTLSQSIPIIQITPAPDESDGYSSDDTLYDSEGQQHHKYEKAVHVRFRPSVPKRIKSAPLPSDDEDSSDVYPGIRREAKGDSELSYSPISQCLKIPKTWFTAS